MNLGNKDNTYSTGAKAEELDLVVASYTTGKIVGNFLME